MRLEDLLQEYRSSLPAAPADGFEELLAAAQTQQRWKTVLPIFAALAACLLMAIAMGWKSQPPVPTPMAQAPSSRPSTSPASTVQLTASPLPPIHRPSRIRRSRPKPPLSPTEDFSGFVPVSSNQLLPESNYLQLLRVSVSRDRLAAMGVPTFSAAADSGENRIAAELLLGEDGLIRAVRVLR